MKKALILSLAVNFLVIGYIVYKKVRVSPLQGSLSSSYASNSQYAEQTSIFPAYNTPCEIALTGDSHIYKCHWTELLGQVICNRGVGSDITQGVYMRIGEIIKTRPKVVFICAGANDIDTGIAPDTTIAFFHRMVDTLKATGIRPVVMEITSVGPGYPNRQFNQKAHALNAAIRGFCETVAITVEDGDWQADNIHLTHKGYIKWADAIKKHLGI